MDSPALTDEKLATILSFFVTFGYVDGQFHASERTFVSEYLAAVLPRFVEATSPDPRVQAEVRSRLEQLLAGTYDRIITEIEGLEEEGPRADDRGDGFIYTRLKVRCIELFHSLACQLLLLNKRF
jgi:hypothetical protein